MIRRAAILGFAAGQVLSALGGSSAAEAPLTADRLRQSLLAACEAGAAPYGSYDRAIAQGAVALIGIGALSAEDFSAVRIGFCALRAAGGPVGVTACGEDVILLDDKYRNAKQSLVLSATLAHEVKHVLQHRAERAARGKAWCDSADYVEQKASLEAEADEFGDAAAALVALGRPIEITSACDKPLTVYLEADDAVGAADPSFLRIAAKGSARAADRALSPRALYFAEAAPTPKGEARSRQSGNTRIVEGRLISLKAARLVAADRLETPFRLTLSCAGEAVENAGP